MSFRMPRGTRVVTLFHDPESAVSQRILRMLQAQSRPDRNTLNGNGGSGKGTGAGQPHTSRAQQYLNEAASNVKGTEGPFELEVVPRTRATPDQWRVIASYMQTNKAKQPTQTELYRLKEEFGPFVVDWDQGKVVRTEAEAEQLANKLANESSSMQKSSNQGDGGGGGCTIV